MCIHLNNTRAATISTQFSAVEATVEYTLPSQVHPVEYDIWKEVSHNWASFRITQGGWEDSMTRLGLAEP